MDTVSGTMTTTIEGALLRTKCLDCGTITFFPSVDLTLEAVFRDVDGTDEFHHYKVTLSRRLTCTYSCRDRFQIRGETEQSVFALPYIERLPNGWVSFPDSKRQHFAIRRKVTA